MQIRKRFMKAAVFGVESFLLCLAVQAQSVTKIIAPDASAADIFGTSVAVSGEMIAIGALGHAGNTSRGAGGAVYIYRWDGFRWNLNNTLIEPTGRDFVQFGERVAITADHLLVGAYRNCGFCEYSSHVYVFERSGTNWTFKSVLERPERAAVLNSNELVFRGPNVNTNIGRREIHLYTFNGTGFIHESSWEAPFDFGNIAIDGNSLVLTEDGGTVHIGRVHMFRRSDSEWVEEASFSPNNLDPTTSFGASTLIRQDWVLVTAFPQADTEGKAFLYHWDGVMWGETDVLNAPGNDSRVGFGRSASMGDGLILIAAQRDGAGDAVYVYRQVGSDWQYMKKLETGGSVLVSADIAVDPKVSVVGAPLDDEFGFHSGAAYIYNFGPFLSRPVGEVEAEEDFSPLVIAHLDTVFADAFGDNLAYSVSVRDGRVEAVIEDRILLLRSVKDQFGSDVVTFTANGGGWNARDELGVLITPVNDAPSSPAISEPTDGANVVLQGMPDSPFVVTWAPGIDPDGDLLTYTWQLSVSDAFSSSDLLISENVGGATRYESDFGTIATHLTDQEVESETPVSLYHRVLASDGELTTSSEAAMLILMAPAQSVDTRAHRDHAYSLSG